MKYVFELNRLGDHSTEIKICIQDKSVNLTPWHVINAKDTDPTNFGAGNDVENVLKMLLDDVRLTVSERIDAEYDLQDFLRYISLNADDVVKTEKYCNKEDDRTEETV